MPDIDDARRLIDEVTPPEGRADLTNPQKIALAQAIATIELAEQVRASNLMTAIGTSALLEVDTSERATTPATVYRQQWRNSARRVVQSIVGAVLNPPSRDGS